MEVKCGGGPAIKVKDRSVICHPEVRKLLEESAKGIIFLISWKYLKQEGATRLNTFDGGRNTFGCDIHTGEVCSQSGRDRQHVGY